MTDVLEGNAQAARDLTDRVFFAQLIQASLADWPQVWTRPLSARTSRLQVTGEDLISLLLSGPATLARWWAQSGLELLQIAA